MLSSAIQTPVTELDGQAKSKVAILDCGAQYTKVIDRRVRALNMESDIFPLAIPAKALANYGAIILSGGPNSVHSDSALPYDPAIFDLNIPVLGICYGMQLIAQHFNGVVKAGLAQEYGETVIQIESQSPVFMGLDASQMVLMSHGDHVSTLPKEFTQIAASADHVVAAIAHMSRPIVGLQFHPEVDLSVNGVIMLDNFLTKVAKLTPSFTLENRLEKTITDLRERVGSRAVLTLVSGGVDSAVTTALLLKALGPENVYALHIDTGMMRLNESELVCKALEQIGLKHLHHYHAAEQFLNATTDLDGKMIGPLNTCVNPEHKRRIIGDTFLRLTQTAIQDLNLNLEETFIAQGTLRPDLIESGNSEVSATAQTIKTHHNDVPLIQEQRKKGLIIEPNRDWHKDEVREIGRLCGLPDELVERQPFPGPGLGIRVLCATEPTLAENDVETRAMLSNLVLDMNLIATLLPIRSVGVQGDARSYRRCVALSDFLPLSADDFILLYELARLIPNRCPDVNRVILSLSENPLPEVLNTIIPTTLTPENLTLLRKVDAFVLETLQEKGLLESLSQTFTVLLPVDSFEKNKPSIVIRAVVTSDFMTARAARLGLDKRSELPYTILTQLAAKIVSKFPIRDVFLDLTSKPPGTVEWE